MAEAATVGGLKEELTGAPTVLLAAVPLRLRGQGARWGLGGQAPEPEQRDRRRHDETHRPEGGPSRAVSES